MRLRHLSWKEVEDAIAIFTGMMTKLREDYPAQYPTTIYGEPRGGLIPAIMLSHRLNLPLIQEKPIGSDYRFLWIDDINDSGKTLSTAIYKNQAGVMLSWTLCIKSRTNLPTNYGIKVEDDEWVVFPWEDPSQAEADFKLYQQNHHA